MFAFIEICAVRHHTHAATGVMGSAWAAQTNLADILGATRYRALRKGTLHHIKCPQKYCYHTDTFLHMLMCYYLGVSVLKGAQAASFLVKMAQRTLIPAGTRRAPYEEELSEQTRRRDAVPRVMPPRQGEETRRTDDQRERDVELRGLLRYPGTVGT